jgi:MFS family permease
VTSKLRGIAIDVGILREYPRFGWLWTGQLISTIGGQISAVAVPYQVYLITHSPLAVGAIGGFQLVPLLLASQIGGTLSDRLDRQKIILVAQAGLAACALSLAILVPTNPSVWLLFLIAAIRAGIGAVDGPTRTATIPSLVPRERLAGALALNMTGFVSAMALGPAIAGFLIGNLGLQVGYFIDFVTFGASFAGALNIGAQPVKHSEKASPTLHAIAEGLRFARSHKVIWAGFGIDLSAMIFGMPTALFPVLALKTFQVGPEGLGLLYSAIGIGSMLAALSSGWISRAAHLGRVLVFAVAIWSLGIICFAFTSQLWLGVVLLVVAGGGDMISGIARSTTLQMSAPDHLRGRLSATYYMVVGGGPFLGNLESGVVATLTSPFFSVLSGGLVSLLGLGFFLARYRELWSYRVPVALGVDAAQAAAIATEQEISARD